MEYILYCDESSGSGPKYGDFFGGCLVSSEDLNEIVQALENRKESLNLNGEVKWVKVTENYLDKYIELISLFFSFVKQGKIKVRIMFRAIDDMPSNFVARTDEDKYFKLYYQFIKNAFGFKYMPKSKGATYVRVYLDQLPDKKENCSRFKEYLQRLPNTRDFQESPFAIRDGDIAEICSHEHILLQCTDVILGCMYFRLNNFHKAIPEGKKRRGKRTIAKETLYNHIHSHITDIYPNFNIGISTGVRESENPFWEHPYRHWKFIPK